MRQFVNEMNCRMEIVGAEYADIITDYTLESEGFFRDRIDLERILPTPDYNLILYLRILLLYPVWRSKGFDVEKAYRELLSVISSIKPIINSAPSAYSAPSMSMRQFVS